MITLSLLGDTTSQRPRKKKADQITKSLRWVIHERYDKPNGLTNDIAIGIVKKIAGTFVPKIAPFEKNPMNPRVGQDMCPIGWGKKNPEGDNGPEGHVLKMVPHKVMHVFDCVTPVPGKTEHDFAHVLCLKGAPGAGACSGDSGSPLYDSNGVVQGVASWVPGCGQGIGYEKVSFHASWIQEKLNSIPM